MKKKKEFINFEVKDDCKWLKIISFILGMILGILLFLLII